MNEIPRARIWVYSSDYQRWVPTAVVWISGFMLDCRAIWQKQGFCTALERIEGDACLN